MVNKEQIRSVTINDPNYPELLNQIKKPPEELYYRGNFNLCHTPCLAVVGSRKATPYGKWAAYNISKLAAEHGVTIVSGMASGIDSCAHMGALDAGGKTIAVLGCGPDICYPRTNRDLMDRIVRLGLILSEYPPGKGPLAGQFPVRNRIISGLSYAVLVVEAGLESGSLITAGQALDQGREVFAVPGNINSMYSAGANKLIADGATPVTSVDDILDLLGIREIRSSIKDDVLLGQDERALLQFIADHGMLTMDRLCLLSGKSPATVSSLVTVLEMKGRVQTSMGKIYIAK